MDQGCIGYHEDIVEESPYKLNLTDRPLLRLVTLCILYVAQGIPYGFVTVTFASYLAERGETVAAIASVTALSTLPWTFKFVWGPFMDRFFLRPLLNEIEQSRGGIRQLPHIDDRLGRDELLARHEISGRINGIYGDKFSASEIKRRKTGVVRIASNDNSIMVSRESGDLKFQIELIGPEPRHLCVCMRFPQ